MFILIDEDGDITKTEDLDWVLTRMAENDIQTMIDLRDPKNPKQYIEAFDPPWQEIPTE